MSIISDSDLENIAIDYGIEILKNIESHFKEKHIDMTISKIDKKVHVEISNFIQDFVIGNTSITYNSVFKKFLPEGEPDQEFKDWYKNLSDEKQIEIGKKIILKF